MSFELRIRATILAAGAATLASLIPVSAAENGLGVYPLGMRANLSGLVPEPGVYLQNDVYYYRGDTSLTVPFHGQLVGDVTANAWINLTTLQWSTPAQIAGGNLALSMTLPIGGPTIDAGVSYVSNNLAAPLARDFHSSIGTIGDPFVVAAIGWHAGFLHWTAGVGVNIPVGDYHEHHLANLAYHHWAADLYGGVTWLDLKNGLELSTSAGVTFNGENPVTHYTSGDEFHLDAAAVKHLPGGFSIGLIGYHYNQFTADSGEGALLGAFKGRISALGGMFGYNFKIDNRDIATRIKVYREFDAINRLEGTAAYFTVALPLTGAPARSEGAKPIVTK